MTDKPNALHTLGLEFLPHTLLGVQLSQKKGRAVLERIYELPFEENTPPSPDTVSQLYANGDGPALQEAYEKALVVTFLNINEVLVRQLEVKLKKDKDIDEVLAFQTEPLLPYPVENALIDKIKIGTTSEGTQLTVIAARKDHIQQHLQHWNALQVEPEVISCAPAALAAFAAQFAPTDQPQLVVHFAHNHTTCILVKEGKLLAAQACHQGMQHLKQAYGQKNFDTLDFSAITKEENPALSDALENLKLDVTRTAYALAKQVKGQEVPTILITGEGATLNQLGAVVCRNLNKTLLTPQPDANFDLTIPQLQKWALPLGAALTCLPDGKDQVNFRQSDYAYPNPWKRYKIPLAIYGALCIALAVAMWYMGNAYLKYKEDGLRKEYAELLDYMHKPYDEFEKEFTAKNPSAKRPIEGEVLNIKQLDEQDITDRLNYLEKDLQSTPDIYPLWANIPTVSDVLAWLSTHPKVVLQDPKTGEKKPLLQIENLSYTLVKRPDMTKKQEHYQAKVEIEFSSPTPKLAREFHDALIAPNALVDPKGEVKWNTNRGLYRASFFLKDKTVYPVASS